MTIEKIKILGAVLKLPPCWMSQLNWDSQQGRDRKTSILALAFWNSKLKVSKYQWKFKPHATQWKMIIHFHYPKNEVFSPAVFNILKEPFIVQKETLHQQKALDLSYLDLEGQGRGIVRRAPYPDFAKSKFRFFQ